MTLRLFALRHVSTKRIVPGTYFRHKKDARSERDRLNQDEPGAYCVTFGPDHRHADPLEFARMSNI